MRSRLRFLVAALAVFLVSAGAVLLAVHIASRALAIAAAVGMLAALILFLLSLWAPRRRVDWERIETEQRLWESGPLGRSWLRTRRRLFERWRL